MNDSDKAFTNKILNAIKTFGIEKNRVTAATQFSCDLRKIPQDYLIKRCKTELGLCNLLEIYMRVMYRDIVKDPLLYLKVQHRGSRDYFRELTTHQKKELREEFKAILLELPPELIKKRCSICTRSIPLSSEYTHVEYCEKAMKWASKITAADRILLRVDESATSQIRDLMKNKFRNSSSIIKDRRGLDGKRRISQNIKRIIQPVYGLDIPSHCDPGELKKDELLKSRTGRIAKGSLLDTSKNSPRREANEKMFKARIIEQLKQISRKAFKVSYTHKEDLEEVFEKLEKELDEYDNSAYDRTIIVLVKNIRTAVHEKHVAIIESIKAREYLENLENDLTKDVRKYASDVLPLIRYTKEEEKDDVADEQAGALKAILRPSPKQHLNNSFTKRGSTWRRTNRLSGDI